MSLGKFQENLHLCKGLPLDGYSRQIAGYKLWFAMIFTLSPDASDIDTEHNPLALIWGAWQEMPISNTPTTDAATAGTINSSVMWSGSISSRCRGDDPGQPPERIECRSYRAIALLSRQPLPTSAGRRIFTSNIVSGRPGPSQQQ